MGTGEGRDGKAAGTSSARSAELKISRVTAALAGCGAHVATLCATAWRRLGHASRASASRGEGERSVMKLGDLTRRSGGTTVWPAQWVELPGPGGTSVVPGAGVLEGLTRLGSRLLLRINVDGHRGTASLEWDPPPAVDDVETVLQAKVGAEIRELGRLDLPMSGGPR